MDGLQAEQSLETDLSYIVSWCLLKRQGSYFNGGTMVFSTNGIGITGWPHVKNEPQPIPYKKYIQNLRWVLDLNIKVNIREYIQELGVGNHFLHRIQEAITVKKIIS